MSTLLEQAIFDAEALKEAAMKNAEASIIEKYSSEVKAAVASLIEQEGEELLGDLEEAPPPRLDPRDVDLLVAAAHPCLRQTNFY